KGCLLSLTFTRRLNSTYPFLVFTLRASEVTKRLLWDLLLIQKMGEYVYGKNARFGIDVFCLHIYISAECFVIYDNHKKLKKFIKPRDGKPLTTYQNRVFKVHNDFKTKNIDDIGYRVHKRSAMQIQKDENGDPISGIKGLYAK